ncbi:MAG: endopeptidase La [Ruminococcaceae bacterium]|nr:endopeptidase La [Oscillospiraceae bacterium]
MPRYIEKAEKLTLPVIPLRGIVAFPSIPLNFELEREISKNACQAALNGDMMVFLLTQKDINVDDPKEGDLYSVGCVAKIKQSLKKPQGGNIRVVAEGYCRASVMELRRENGCFYADVMSKTITADFNMNDLKTEAIISETMNTLDEMLRYIPSFSDDFIVTASSITNPGLLADFIASSVFVRFQDKAEILEVFDPMKRAEKAIILMKNEMKLLQAELEIQRKVKKSIDDNQRDYYLREQLKAIESELGIDEDSAELTKKVAAVKLPAEVKERLEKEITKLGKTPQGSPEAAVIRNYVETCLEIPWSTKTKDRVDIDAARKILDADHDGLTKIKERILEYLAVKQLNPELKNQIICFVGPPGVGKTSLGASIARAMKRKYVRVSLGGIRDESDIRGHRKTYIGSMPGRIITALTQCGSLNPVMLLDEVDKMCSDVHGDPASALLEVLDGEQNKAFRDHFIELPVDLSDCMFIATANTLDTIPRPLLDRMEVIELHTYTPAEKLAIAKNHLLPKQLKRHGLNKRMLKITDAAIEEIIAGYTRESGVRNLEREIASLCRKGAKVIVEEGKKSVTIDKVNMEAYLGPRKIIDDSLSERDLVGVTNGLAYTEVGGDMLKVEVLAVDGSGKIELTGTLGDVMKESAHIAVTYTRAHCDKFGIPADFYKTKDLHIHVPEGAVPKDGPSAGVTMTTSIISALSKIPVRRDIAMTGEITLTGRVLAIGGLREKSTAAYAMGIRTILIPADNMRDVHELDSVVAQEVKFIPCSTLDDVLRVALVREREFDIDLSDNEKADKRDEKKIVVQPSKGKRIYGTV